VLRDSKFGQGVGRVGESGMGVQVLEEFGKIGSGGSVSVKSCG
jgi:hypothetical protein